MGQTLCTNPDKKANLKKLSTFERDNSTAYSSYESNQILKEQVKIMIIGTKSSGKSTLINKLLIGDQKQDESLTFKQLPSGGIQFKNVKIQLDDIQISNQVVCRFLDVEGDFFDQLEHLKMHFKSCDGFILMTDISDSNCVQESTRILKELQKHISKKPLLLFANKYEQVDQQQQKNELKNLSNSYNNCIFSTCSLRAISDYKKPIQEIVFASAKFPVSLIK